MSFDTPVVLLVFNRPNTTQRVFEVISQIKPKQLFIVADAPRANHPTDQENCTKVRSIVEQVTWSCEVHRNYADSNMGCRDRPVSGIDWAFQHVDKAIILEDDCLPNLSFFHFCHEVLDIYQYDERVMCVSGSNFQVNRESTEFSYYFSKYIHTWGWATWKRAWTFYDKEIKDLDYITKRGLLHDILANKSAVSYWKNILNSVIGRNDVWDAQWVLSCWMQNGLCIIPKYNLVSNIGFGEGATHTFWKNIFAELPTKEMEFPLTHPPFMVPNRKADQFIENVMFNRSIISRLRRNLGIWV
jgi:hypothetical protein